METDLRCLSREFLGEFIYMYKSYPCLWKIKSKEYSNREMKKLAYDSLVVKMKEVDKNATKESVVKKINSLRTCYRKELRKYTSSLKFGFENVYKPNLWYFDLLQFLNGQETPPREEDMSTSLAEEEEEEIKESTENFAIQKASPSEEFIGSVEPPKYVFTPCQSNLRKRKISKSDEVLDIILDRLKPPSKEDDDDVFDAQSKVWAYSIRSLNKMQAVYAKKLISDVLFEAELGNLNSQSKLTVTPLSSSKFIM